MRWIKRHTLTAAVVCLLVAFALWHFYPGVPAQWLFLGLGGALLLLSLAFNAGEARTAMGTRTARYGAGAAVMALLALGIVVAANAISMRHSVRWDFTENKRNSVSPQTIQVLRTLKAPVSAIAFFRSDTPGKKTAEDLLTQYATYSRGKFTWRLEDTDRAPALARQYGVESYGTVVLEGGPAGQTRTEKVQDAEEEKLTNAIVKITRAGKRVIYALKGHGEREIGSTDRAGFVSKEQMEKELRGQGPVPGPGPENPRGRGDRDGAEPEDGSLPAGAGRARRLHREGGKGLLHGRALPGRDHREVPDQVRDRGGR
jgi:hypothetical protein